jgi:hypothetical protein
VSIRTQGNSATIASREGRVTVTDHGATITITMNHPTITVSRRDLDHIAWFLDLTPTDPRKGNE